MEDVLEDALVSDDVFVSELEDVEELDCEELDDEELDDEEGFGTSL